MLDEKALLWGLPAATERLLEFGAPFLKERPRAVPKLPGARDALQEIVNDFFDGFLSQEDRLKIGEPRIYPALAPPRVVLAKHSEGFLPKYDRQENTVLFPKWLAQPGGVIGWVTLAHETSGHAVLNAYRLHDDLKKEIADTLKRVPAGKHWKRWFEEAAADCLAVLNLGPMMAIGSIACWRAMGQVTSPDHAAKLACEAPEVGGVHPPPVMRAFVMADVIGRLSFRGARDLALAIKAGIAGELKRCGIDAHELQAATLFVELLVERPRAALNGHSFIELQNWSDQDQEITSNFKQALLGRRPPGFEARHYAAHALAAAIERIVTGHDATTEQRVTQNLLSLLKNMYASPRGKRARKELGTLKSKAGKPDSVPSLRTAGIKLAVTKSGSSSFTDIRVAERQRMATGKKKTKAKKKKKTTVNLADGISRKEAKQILSALPPKVKTKLQSFW